MDARRVAQVLDEMGTLLEVRGENPFRCRAYHTAADALRAIPGDLAEMIADGTLKQVPGIGETLLSKITQLATTGHLPSYEELKRTTPPGLLALWRIPGLGPKKIKALWEGLGIQSLDDLKAAGESGQIAKLKGFAAKTQAQILEGIAFIASTGERILQSEARRLIVPLLEAVRARPEVRRAEACGSLRRRAETIGDLDILAAADDPAPVLEMFVTLPWASKVLAHGEAKASIRLPEGVQCDLRVVTEAQFPFALHYFTGSKAHNIAMRRRAIARGGKLSEYALEMPDGPAPCRDEADLFRALGLAEIPPELREDQGEIEAAESGTLPRLIERSDLTGTFHCHTDWSDGGNTLEEMAEAARARGFRYLGIADHSRSAGYANGLSIERIHRQWAEIDALNARYGDEFRLLKGTECDILVDGSLDYPDEVLAGFDYVVASVHSSFRQPREVMTERIIRAARNPHVTMLGHLTGRLLLARDGYDVDVDAVLKACAEAGTLVEINANPHRLDIDAIGARKAKALGIKLAINPDAHSVGGLDDLDYGVGVARRAWLTAEDVLNALPLPELLRFLAK